MPRSIKCKRCGIEFHYRGVGRPPRLCSDACRAANKAEIDKARYERERERILSQKRQYHILNREAIRVKDTRYHAENREARNAAARDWRMRNLEDVRAKDRERHMARRGESLAGMRERRLRMQARTPAERAADSRRLNPTGMKRCRRGHDAPISSFYGDSSRSDALSLYCSEHYARRNRDVLDEGWDCSVCFYCGNTMTAFHVDHVVPVARGGADDARNYAPACATCNLSKNDTLVADWYLRKFGLPYEAGKHPHATWLAAQYPGMYPVA